MERSVIDTFKTIGFSKSCMKYNSYIIVELCLKETDSKNNADYFNKKGEIVSYTFVDANSKHIKRTKYEEDLEKVIKRKHNILLVTSSIKYKQPRSIFNNDNFVEYMQFIINNEYFNIS